MSNDVPDIDGHGDISERELNTRRHDGVKTLFCERCGNHVPRDEPERFDEIDCDRYERVREGISSSL